MTIAIKYGSLVDEPLVDDDGNFAIKGSGGALVERLLKIFPGSCLVGYQDQRANGFEIKRVTSLDPVSDLVINLDVMDSVGTFQVLHRNGAEPKIMNLQWLPPRHYHHRVNFAALGLSYALFPTLCAGERTASEVTELCHRWGSPAIRERAPISWFYPGVHDDLVQAHRVAEVPTVLYPTIHVSDDKQPKVFMSIVSQVAGRMKLRMEACLSERELVSMAAMRMSSHSWTHVGPVFGRRENYWESLAGMTAFLSTAREEAYSLEYLEALLAGVIGVLPRREWVKGVVPDAYPYLYGSEEEAADMLEEVLRDPQGVQARIDEASGGSIHDWILTHHARAAGNKAIYEKARDWFPEVF